MLINVATFLKEWVHDCAENSIEVECLRLRLSFRAPAGKISPVLRYVTENSRQHSFSPDFILIVRNKYYAII